MFGGVTALAQTAADTHSPEQPGRWFLQSPVRSHCGASSLGVEHPPEFAKCEISRPSTSQIRDREGKEGVRAELRRECFESLAVQRAAADRAVIDPTASAVPWFWSRRPVAR